MNLCCILNPSFTCRRCRIKSCYEHLVVYSADYYSIETAREYDVSTSWAEVYGCGDKEEYPTLFLCDKCISYESMLPD